MTRLADRTAVVTGASSGNGRLIARALAAEGAAVVCADLQPAPRPGGYDDDPDAATDEVIRARGGRAVFHRTDVTSPGDHRSLVERTVAEFGRIDVWVNNAGVGVGFGPIQDNSLEDLQTAVAVNIQGTWMGCRAAIGQMLQQDVVGRARGRIVNLGSVAADGGAAFLGIYTMTKGAVHSLTRSLAIECAGSGINVNAVAPAYLPTAMTRDFFEDPDGLAHIKEFQPWFELPRPEDVAGPVVFLASDEAAFVTGVVLPVDGGALAK